MSHTATATMGSDGPLSPVSQRMTKAAFFRARSPGVPEKTSPIGDLAGRFDHAARLQDDRAGPSTVESVVPATNRFTATHGYASSVGTAGHTPPLDRGLARNPTISSDGPSSPYNYDHAAYPNMHNESDDTAYDEDGYEASKESSMTGMAGSSDEMLMSLLAGQAAMDCENLPIARWEEVESWKKACRPKVLLCESLSSRN